MQIYQDGVEVFVSEGYCELDPEKQDLLKLSECPIGEEYCTGDCIYYAEDW